MSISIAQVISLPLGKVIETYPRSADFFANIGLEIPERTLPLLDAVAKIDAEALSELGLERHQIFRDYCQFIDVFCINVRSSPRIESLQVIGGAGKDGQAELPEFEIRKGEVVSIVGPTGSGKSRLLADIECLACGDTVTRRVIKINGKNIEDSDRDLLEGRLVAQLSQNMNFVMDLSVADFLQMHAQSRMVDNGVETVKKCYECAVSLAGEKFDLKTKVTQLSGGQSRALMIADAAFMSDSPIVLIDEIENAGIDRRQAVQLLVKAEKLVLMSTHDPLLALSANRRIVIHNGAIIKVIETCFEEKKCLGMIEEIDTKLSMVRSQLRQGESVSLQKLRG